MSLSSEFCVSLLLWARRVKFRTLAVVRLLVLLVAHQKHRRVIETPC